jgi:hypothetical protein
MRTARTPQAEWRQALRGSVGTGAKENEARTKRIWAAGFHHVMPHSCLVGAMKLTKHLFP